MMLCLVFRSHQLMFSIITEIESDENKLELVDKPVVPTFVAAAVVAAPVALTHAVVAAAEPATLTHVVVAPAPPPPPPKKKVSHLSSRKPKRKKTPT